MCFRYMIQYNNYNTDLQPLSKRDYHAALAAFLFANFC